MEVGNIITQGKIDIGNEFKIYSSLDEISNKSLPTLIVGCEFCKSLFGVNLDFNSCNVKDNIFWTFTKKELRKNYFNDLEKFIQYSFKNSITNIKYVYLDLIIMNFPTIKKIIKKIISLDKPISYMKDNMIYIYSDNIIFGVDLNLVDMVDYSKDKVIKKIQKNSLIFIFGNEILLEYKDYLERFDNKLKFVPYIYSVVNK
jgi:hypothetical protein